MGREAQGREEKVVLTTLRLRGGRDLGGEVFKVLERLGEDGRTGRANGDSHECITSPPAQPGLCLGSWGAAT